MRHSVTLEIIRLDRNGKRTGIRRIRGHSWVKQAAQIFVAHLRDENLAGVLDTSSASQTIDRIGLLNMSAIALITDDSFGIQVGTGTTAVDRDDVALATQIVEGTGSGQLDHLGVVVNVTEGITGGFRVQVNRQFDNNSGGTITLQEVGLVVQHTTTTPGTAQFLLLRDLISGGEAILTGTSRVVRVRIDGLV